MSDIFNVVIESFQYGFIIRAFLAGIFISISASLLGVFLVLKNYSLIGDGLAHVTFASVGLAFVFQKEPLLFSLPIVILASLLILKISENKSIHNDSAIGMVSTLALAFGIVLVSVAQGFNADLFSYLFGSILLVSEVDLWLSVASTLLVVGFVYLYYYDLFLISYDEEFALLNQVKVKRLNYFITILMAIVIVISIRILGTMLISAMIIFPIVSAMQCTKGFLKTTLTTITFAILGVVIGLLCSIILNLPSGATIVLTNGIIFLFCYCLNKLN